MTIWIHIGLVKTGTTTIQNFLAGNSEKLAGHGYLYPTGKPGGPGYAAHFFLAHELRGHPKFDGSRGCWDDVTRLQLENPGASVIVSAESFQHLARQHVAAMRRKLTGFDVRIIVYLRQQSQLIESWYMQKLKTGRTHVEFEKFLQEKRDETLTFSKLLSAWDVFGRENIVVRTFERSQMVGRDLLDDFCSVVGLPLPSADPSYERPRNFNESPGPLSLALAEMFYKNQMLEQRLSDSESVEPSGENSVQPEMTNEQKRLLRKAVRREMTANGAAGAPDTPMLKDPRLLDVASRIWPNQEKVRLMTAQQQRALMSEYEEDNALVVERYLPSRVTPLFVEAAKDLPPNYTNFADVLKQAKSEELVEAFGYLLGVIGARRKARQIKGSLL